MEKKLELDKSLVFAEVSMMVPKQVDAVQAATWAPWPRQARSLLVDPKVVLELDLSLVFAAVSKEGPKQVVAMPWAAWCWRLWTRSLLHFVGSWEAYWRWGPLSRTVCALCCRPLPPGRSSGLTCSPTSGKW